MKKNKILFIIFLCLSIYVIMPMSVEAKTVCIYNFNVGDVKGGFFDTLVSDVENKDITIRLETEDNDKLLTKATASIRNVSFANTRDNGIKLKSDGSCPQISVYTQKTYGEFKLYASKTNCINGKDTTDENCSDNLKGEFGDTDTSASNDTGNGYQFKLVTDGSSESEPYCSYRYLMEGVRDVKALIYKDENKTNGCNLELGATYTCSVEVKDRSQLFYENDKFTCPTYIYANEIKVETPVDLITFTHYTYSFYEKGGEADENRTDLEDSSDFEMLETDSPQDCGSIFGDINDDTTVGWLIAKVLNYLKILGPVLVIILSSMDFIKAIANSDEDSMKKAQKRFVVRLVLAIALFFVPMLVEVVLKLSGLVTDNPTCGLNTMNNE